MTFFSFISLFSPSKLSRKVSLVLVFALFSSAQSSGQVWESVCNASVPLIHGGRLLAAYGTARFSGPALLKSAGNAGVAVRSVKSLENMRTLILAAGECGVFAGTLWSMSGGVPSVGEAVFAVLMRPTFDHNLQHFQRKLRAVAENAPGIDRGITSVSAALPPPRGQMPRAVSPLNKYLLAPLHFDPVKLHTLLHIPDFFEFIQSIRMFSPKTQGEVDFAQFKVFLSTALLCVMVKSPDFAQNKLFGIIEVGVGIHALSEHVFPLLSFLEKEDKEPLPNGQFSYSPFLAGAAIGVGSAYMGPLLFSRFFPSKDMTVVASPIWMAFAVAAPAMGRVFVSEERIWLASHFVTQFFMVKYFSLPAFRDKPLELHLLLEMHGVVGTLVSAGVDNLYHYFSTWQSLPSVLSDHDL